jgi:hypothetical protein
VKDLKSWQNLVESAGLLRHITHVKAATKRRPKSDAELLDHAVNNLLTALKCEMIEKDGGIDRHKLEKDGYGPRLLDRLEEA